jgi:hypothetical protein
MNVGVAEIGDGTKRAKNKEGGGISCGMYKTCQLPPQEIVSILIILEKKNLGMWFPVTDN